MNVASDDMMREKEKRTQVISSWCKRRRKQHNNICNHWNTMLQWFVISELMSGDLFYKVTLPCSPAVNRSSVCQTTILSLLFLVITQIKVWCLLRDASKLVM